MSAPGSESVGAPFAAAQLSEPAWVRNGSAQVQREYALGLEFERLLVQQLATSLTETTEPAGEGEGQEGAVRRRGERALDMLPGALADGVLNGGGLGLAAELTKGICRATADSAVEAAAPRPPRAASKPTPRAVRAHERDRAGERRARAGRPRRGVLAHLDAQIASARGLLGVVLEQGAAIRARDVDAVVRLAGILRGEMGRRELLEEDRTRLLARCGERLGARAETVTLQALLTLMSPDRRRARERAQRRAAGASRTSSSASTRRNRAIMQIELGFLDHLMAMLALDGVTGYDTRGTSTPITRGRPHGGLHVLDLSA